MHKRHVVAAILGLGAVGLMLFTGCGRMPPDEFWTWTAQDSTAVDSIVRVWKAKLMSDFNEDMSLAESIKYIPDTTRTALRIVMRENPYKPRFFPATFGRTFLPDSHYMKDSLIITKDTTITVKLTEYFAGTVTIHTDSATRFIMDTIISGMPFKLYDTLFTDSAFTVEIPFSGTAERELFLDKDSTDTYWVMKRLTGAGRYYSPDATSAPYLGSMQLVTPGGRRDTLVLRPDSVHFGAQRLYAPDSLPTYAVGEKINILLNKSVFFNHLWWDPGDIYAYLHVGHARRTFRPIPGDTTTFSFDTPGLKQVFVEIIPRAYLTEYVPQFYSTMWGLELNIK